MGKGQIPMDRKMRDRILPEGESLDHDMSMLGRVCKVERQVRPIRIMSPAKYKLNAWLWQ